MRSSLATTRHGEALDCIWRTSLSVLLFAGAESAQLSLPALPARRNRKTALSFGGKYWTGISRPSRCIRRWAPIFSMTGERSFWQETACGNWRRKLLEASANHRRGPRGIGSGVAVCPAWRRRRIIRDAAGARDSRPPDGGLRGTGLLQFAEIRQRKHRALVVKRGDAASRFPAARNRP